MFLLIFIFAITIHKSQELTLNKIVMNISLPDFQSGLIYVAISRVRGVRGLIFDHPFNISRFKNKITDIQRERRTDKNKKSRQCIF